MEVARKRPGEVREGQGSERVAEVIGRSVEREVVVVDRPGSGASNRAASKAISELVPGVVTVRAEVGKEKLVNEVVQPRETRVELGAGEAAELAPGNPSGESAVRVW